MECVQGQSSRKTCCDCDLLLISAAHGWPNMIKVCAVSLKTHLSSVDLNSLKWKLSTETIFLLVGAFKTPPTSEICWLAAENVSVMRSLMPLCSSPQILKKSCIEILAAEPSSICAGGKTREIYI